MKQKDLALLVLIIGISAIFSLVISKAVFFKNSDRQTTVQVIQPISSNFSQPDPTYFSSANGAYDPTQFINISPNNNANPF